MSSKIRKLPEDMAKAIAAGEVVERPASVVKELIENAIDAGSSAITVELKAGGLQLIRVEDNGEGMTPEDIPLALQRYATSKLRTVEDLYNIRTLGFRGEALPSIASASHLVIESRVPHAPFGTRIRCEGGEIAEVSEVGCPVGTQVEVKHLFYNLPVKRKFLKSIPSELRQILIHFLKLSLSHPSVSFTLIHDGRILHDHLKTSSLPVRIESILGEEVYPHLQPFEFQEGEIALSGFASRPSLTKGTGEGISLFVNQRHIRDRVIYRAVLEAYRHVIPSGRYPVVVLFITLPPSAVDVNVHPTKAEVKFKDPERVFQSVTRALRSIQEGVASPAERVSDVGRQVGPSRRGEGPAPSLFREGTPGDPARRFVSGIEEKGYVREKGVPEWAREETIPFRILGQVQGTYILCEGQEGVILIDQHAAHERILFEKFKKELEERSVPITKFLIPLQFEVSAEESLVLSLHLEEFRSVGFDLDPMGKNTFALRSTPSLIETKDAIGMVRTILDDSPFDTPVGKGRDPLQGLLVTLACRAAIPGNSVLNKEEIEALVVSLAPFPLSSTCPHGRPLYVVFSGDELKKRFKRT